MKLDLQATVGDVLHWDQHECSVLVVAMPCPAIEVLRANRGKPVRVTLELDEPRGQRELFGGPPLMPDGAKGS